ncbi:MAG: exo-alpha-sialidase [Micromonosporaceae bacterium]
MRSRKPLPIIAIGALLLGTAQFAAATGASAQPFGYGKLTPAQKRHVSGLLSLELGGAGTKTAAPAKTSLTTVTPPGCDMNLGSNIKVNQNCLNIADSDLQGRSQAQNETWVAVDPLNPRNIIATYNDYRRGDGTCGISYSTNGGKNWADATAPNGFVRGTAYGGFPREYMQAGGDTSVAWDTRGNAYLACQEFKRGNSVTEDADQSSAFYVYRSTGTNGASWNFTGRPVVEHNDVAGAGNFLYDKELLTVDNSVRSPFRDRVYVTWTTYAEDGTAYIYESHSADYGENFSTPVLVSTDSSLCVHPISQTHPSGNCDNNQFSEPFTAPDGTLYVVWDNFNNALAGSGDNHNQVLLARSTDGGASFSAPVKVGDFYDLPDCATYQNGADAFRACVPEKGSTAASIFRAANYPYGSVDPRHPNTVAVTYASYINRNSNENNGCIPAGFSSTTGLNLYTGVKTPGACHNAIVLSVSGNGGASFTGTGQDVRTLPVTESTAAQRRSDQYWQGMAFTASGKLVVGAYDRAYGSDETTGFSDISLWTSANLKNFTSQRVTTSSMPPQTEFGGLFFGDYIQIAVTGNTAYPVWSDTRAKELFLCPGTGTPGNPPQVCTGAGANFSPANDEEIYTAKVALP